MVVYYYYCAKWQVKGVDFCNRAASSANLHIPYLPILTRIRRPFSIMSRSSLFLSADPLLHYTLQNKSQAVKLFSVAAAVVSLSIQVPITLAENYNYSRIIFFTALPPPLSSHYAVCRCWIRLPFGTARECFIVPVQAGVLVFAHLASCWSVRARSIIDKEQYQQ